MMFFFNLPIIFYMIRVKVLFSLCLGTFVYVLISVLGGQNGIWAMNQLEEQKKEISLHTAEIAKTNNELAMEYTALKQDGSVVAAYARRLGYVAEGEKLVKISGLAPYYDPIYNAGSVKKIEPVLFIPEWICKIVAYFISLFFFVMWVLRDYLRQPKVSKAKKTYSVGLKSVACETIGGIKVENL